jgi:hypothetical protein
MVPVSKREEPTVVIGIEALKAQGRVDHIPSFCIQLGIIIRIRIVRGGIIVIDNLVSARIFQWHHITGLDIQKGSKL